MSKEGMTGMDLATQEMLRVGETLTDEQWLLPSAATGWSVKGVVAHTGCLMAFLMAAVGGAAGPDIGIEELN
jgi:Mycothiol maleylpyruvate isomerase N-terminal domain